MAEKNYFGNKIKELRRLSKLTQDQVSIETGIKQPHLSQYECGKSEPSFERGIKIACIYISRGLISNPLELSLKGTEIMVQIGTDLADLFKLVDIIPTAVQSRLLNLLKMQLVKTNFNRQDWMRIVYCLEIFADLVANPSERKENLEAVQKVLEALQKTRKPASTGDI